MKLNLYRLCFSVLLLASFSCTSSGSTQGVWDELKLKEALTYADGIGTYALLIQTDGEIIASYGHIDTVSRVHSVRKVIIGALVFQNLENIDLKASLKDLNIQDHPIPLTALQQTAKVIHLLKSTSAINHPTGSQVGSMQEDRDLLLGSEPNVPGEKWAYNNWDYNVLTTILEQETGDSTSQLFEEGIARPLGIKDFEVIYRRDTTLSQHAKAGFRLSTRDMAKIGQLYLNNGKWQGKQLIPEEWVQKITTDYTITSHQNNERYGHGYLWWIQDKSYADGLLPTGSYVATGAWGQRILVIPTWNTVIAHKTMTEGPKAERTRVKSSEFEKLVKLICEARLSSNH
ncbi:MAG: serine hydrolase [Bacteroidota bacterium]